MQVVTENQKSLREMIEELKSDGRDFLSTRLQMLRQEMKEKISIWMTGIPLLIGAAAFGIVAFLSLTFALIAFLAGIFEPSPYAWCYGALIVGLFYCCMAGGLALLGKREISQTSLTPDRTLRVLKEDQIWMQSEARSQA